MNIAKSLCKKQNLELYLAQKTQGCDWAGLGGDDARSFAFLWALYAKLDMASNLCKKSVIFSYAHVITRVHPGAALTYDDTACRNKFTAIAFNAQTF